MKPKKPKILRVVRTDDFVKIRSEVLQSTEQKSTPDPKKPGETKTKEVTSSEFIEVEAHEAPLPAFDRALQALAAVAAKQLETPPDWKKGVTVTSFLITHTKSGVRSCAIFFHKNLDATAGLHPMKTPVFQIDDGKTPDEGRRQCAEKHAELVDDAITQAQRYAMGERSQQMLNLKEEEDDDDKIEQLPGMTAGEDGNN